MARKKKGLMTKVGPWTFILGLIIAIATALLIPPNTGLLWVLGILGLIVGLMNISDEEVRTYLIATIAFLVSASSLTAILEPIPILGSAAKPFMTNVVVFIAPGAGIVALKALYMISKD
ncbi:hypothetical protein JXB41_08335 [Candidatus Woesearchaeota archaeon]|nr:hypothetical protein [Candidatus Woesearchaeota archaeon]